MKLTKQFEEILKNLDPEGKNYPEVFNNLVNAVKTRDEEVLGEKKSSIEKCTDHECFAGEENHSHRNPRLVIENMRTDEIKQKMEETL